MANNPQFKAGLLMELQKQKHFGYQAPSDDIYGQSSLFKGGNWRDRKQGRLGNDGDGGFADNLEEDDPLRRRMTKTSIVVAGMFSAQDMKGEDGDQNKSALPGGLFDDSDEEKELKKEMMKVQEELRQSSAKKTIEQQKKPDLFAIDDDEDDLAYMNKQKEEEKKKIAKKLLGDSDDEDEFKPQLRKPSVIQAAPPIPPQPPA